MRERLRRVCFDIITSNKLLYDLAKRILKASPRLQKLNRLLISEPYIEKLTEFKMNFQDSERFLKRIKTYFDGGTSVGKENDDLAVINQRWNINNENYKIFSHRRILGPFLVRGRKLVHGEVKRYVDPIFSQQREFNASVVRILNKLTEDIRFLSSKTNAIEEKLSSVETEIKEELVKKETRTDLIEEKLSKLKEELGKKIEEIETELKETKRCVENISSEVYAIQELTRMINELKVELSRTEGDIRFLSSKTNAIEEKLSSVEEKMSRAASLSSEYYFLFEERFRGSRELVKDRLKRYIPYFRGCSRVLDIGCGRGEFLELCKEEGIGAVGIDINEDMIKFCEGKFNVVKSDAIEYLKSLPEKHLDGIIISHLAEHLEPESLFELLSLCYRKMKYSSYLVIEAPNPTTLCSLINFYVDPTHKKPLHPEVLKFTLEYLGFRDVKIEFFEEVGEGTKLSKISSNATPEEVVKVLNENIEKLNKILFGPQDYAVIAKK